MSTRDSEAVGARWNAIQARVAEACARCGRDRSEVRLVGAGKRQSIERLLAAYEQGLRIFGENQVQEALRHGAELPKDIDWHLIGPLQSNKAGAAAAFFSTVHSIDRVKIARVLDRRAGELGRTLEAFVEINLAAEPTKHGFAPGALEDLQDVPDLQHLRVVGLMAIPPLTDDDNESRRWFRRLRELRDELFSRARWSGRPGYLSMGMSADFEIAIEEGATHIRIGSALFGERPT